MSGFKHATKCAKHKPARLQGFGIAIQGLGHFNLTTLRHWISATSRYWVLEVEDAIPLLNLPCAWFGRSSEPCLFPGRRTADPAAHHRALTSNSPKYSIHHYRWSGPPSKVIRLSTLCSETSSRSWNFLQAPFLYYRSLLPLTRFVVDRKGSAQHQCHWCKPTLW